MGVLRFILALAVISAHLGPLGGVRFFEGGVMAVESFYMISGFYMALVLSSRYHDDWRDFYFNRFLRLYPIYWMLLTVYVVTSGGYWLVAGHPLGVLAAWQGSAPWFARVWAGFANVAIIGSDWAAMRDQLLTEPNTLVLRLVALAPVWTLAVELTFYAFIPLLMRCTWRVQAGVWALALALRLAIVHVTAVHWSPWTYYFAPASWVLFLTGVQAYHLMGWLGRQAWFVAYGRSMGYGLLGFLVLTILFYQNLTALEFQDYRYYLLFALSLPFIFVATRSSRLDAYLAAWSYPLYLGHWTVRSLSPPLRHYFAPESLRYVMLLLTFILCWLIIQADHRIQARFKRVVV